MYLADMQALTPTARVILGLVGLGARTGYDVKRVADISTKFFWGASYGQIYPELKRLEESGLVAGEDDPRGAVHRRAYRLTPRGERVLHDWLVSEESSDFSVRDEGLLRIFFGDLLEHGELLAAVRKLRDEHARRLARFREIEAGMDDDGATALALEYGIALLEWNVGFWSKIDSRLSSADPARPGHTERDPAPDRR
jgi:DNA-binding PadR family transcriptional regulator